MSYFIGVDIGASTVKLGLYESVQGIIGVAERLSFPG
jgi:sugar (pentulose or hexulose) kinase